MKTQNTSALNVRRLSKLERSQFTLSYYLKSILVGLLLGDLCASKQNLSINPTLRFEQGLVHKDYIFHLYELFKDYCLSAPKISNMLPNKTTGKIYTRVQFNSCALPCFSELYELFYTANGKIVPQNIAELLTPLSLAYWICDDGGFCKTRQVIYLSTNAFTEEEVKLLISVLNNKWDLNCTINKHGQGFRIRIPKKSMPVVQALLSTHMPSMMRFKLGL